MALINDAREGIIQALVTIDALIQQGKYSEAQVGVRNLIQDIKESEDNSDERGDCDCQ